MRATLQPVEGNRVKLSVEVDEAEFEKALDAAFRKLARQARVPGFRPGKAPRRILEARMGREAFRREALEEALPGYYAQALEDQDVDAIAAPEIDITSGETAGAVAFDAVVQIRPSVSVAGYAGLQVTVPSVDVSDEDVDAQLDRLRDQFGELRAVSRPAREGDHVTIDVKGYRHSETIDALTADDLLYEVGSASIVPEMDEQLRGANPGDIFKFNADVPGAADPGGGEAGAGSDQPGAERGALEVSFQVLVKEIKEKILPEPTDEWAAEASEFETLAELRDDMRTRITSLKKLQARMALRDGALDALVRLVEDEAPEALVQQELERRLHDLGHRLEAQGASLADYVAASGASQESFVEELRTGAAQGVLADLALRALAEAEDVEVTDEELEAEIGRTAERLKEPVAKLRSQLESGGRLEAVRSDMRSSKALTWLLDQVELVDDEGNAVDRAILEIADADDGTGTEASSTSTTSTTGTEAGGAPEGDSAAGGPEGESGEESTVEGTA